MNKEPHYSSFLSSFTVNIFFVVLVIVGAAMIPLLSLQLNPTGYLPSLNIKWSWPEAPARVVEREVTSLLEGTITTVSGVRKISSYSNDGTGNIVVEFDRNTDLSTKRFEIASLLRQAREKLPESVSYPEVYVNTPSGSTGSVILSFRLNGNASPSYIHKFAEERIKPAIALVKGVYNVNIYGATPLEWKLLYDLDKLNTLGLNASDLNRAVVQYQSERELGGLTERSEYGLTKRTYLTLNGNNTEGFRWEDIPVTKVSDRIIYLSDLVKVRLEDQTPRSYYRINGLNTVNINVLAARNINNIRIADEVKEAMEKIKDQLPSGYSLLTSIDSTILLKKEILKNIYRAILSVILLLLFVLLVSREFRYLLIISISLISNIFISFIFYYLFRLEIHLYSLAGITVSFGIIINNTIVLVDHLRFRKDLKAGISLLASTLTTIGALSIIFFLDESSRLSLSDFAAVVIINLLVSLGIAILFVPSLFEKLGLNEEKNKPVIKRKRRAARFSKEYLKLIVYFKKKRAVFVIIAILLFGLPVFLLPDTLSKEKLSGVENGKGLYLWQKFYNMTLGKESYVRKIKPVVNKALGGTLRLFSEKVKESRFYFSRSADEIWRTQLTVEIGLSEEGLTIEDINNTCIGLENILAGYDEIDLFTTSIYDEKRAVILITFKPDYDFSIFPYSLKIRIENYMNGIGSYHTNVSGVGKAFSNEIYSDYIRTSYSVIMRGFNYDDLYSYCEALADRLHASGKGRIKEVYLLGDDYSGYLMYRGARKVYRNKLFLDKYFLAQNDIANPKALNLIRNYSRAPDSEISAYYEGSEIPVSVGSIQSNRFDSWRVWNEPLEAYKGKIIKLNEFSLVKRNVSDKTIRREDQQYVITVGYDFIGNYDLGSLILERNINETNSILPIGFTAQSGVYKFTWDQQKGNYWLILLVIMIIFFVCAILFESLSQPFIVICLIPFSFIGVFLTFSIFDIQADEGVLAAMILLCGIVVNASIYILNDYSSICRQKPRLDRLTAYLKAFNGKIVSIMLTKLSIIISLIPFLMLGKDERFWFALAAGTIGGLIFSMIGLFIFQPMFLSRSTKKEFRIIHRDDHF